MSAIFSEDRVYRYSLYRDWPMEKWLDGSVAFVGLNPSTADEKNDDPTIRRCCAFAKFWGFQSMFMLNLFAFRAADPRKMLLARDPIGPDNDRWLREISKTAAVVVAAWGRKGEYRQRDKAVLKILGTTHQIGEASYPRHPLYLKSDSPLVLVPSC